MREEIVQHESRRADIKNKTMKISQKGIDLIKKFEGFRSEAYICPGGVITIGYGHTRNVKYTDRISKEQAEQLLREDLEKYEAAVLNYITANITQKQFDALVSLCFNIGPAGFFNSPVRRLVNEDPNQLERIGIAFSRHNRAGGQVLPGLTKRREEEFKLYKSDE